MDGWSCASLVRGGDRLISGEESVPRYPSWIGMSLDVSFDKRGCWTFCALLSSTLGILVGWE